MVLYCSKGIPSNELFNIYYSKKHERLENRTKKYVLKDVEIQKYNIGNFRSFQRTKDIDVSSQIHTCYALIRGLHNEHIEPFKPFVVGYLI